MDPVQQIKDKLNIIDVITPYVQLRKRGSNWFGLCPFHNEKTGSFSVNEDRGFFHCFGCGESGDIFSFIEKIEHTDFRGSLEILAKTAGVDISNAKFDNKYNEKKTKLIEINELTRKYYIWILKKQKSGERGREYVKKRNINEDTADIFGLGYAPIGYTNLYDALIKKGYTEQDILEAGVCIRNEKTHQIIDKFRGRLMFPIESTAGETVGFSGRDIPIPNPKFEPPRYLNTGETMIFNKGRILFGFNQAKEEIAKLGYVIISEGQMNILSSYQAGEKNIVASMGTALTPEHLKLLSRYSKNIYFCFDNDNAGRTALNRSIKLALAQDLAIRVISLRFGKDPDEEIKKDVDSWKGDINNAKDAFDYLIEESLKDFHTINDKNKILSNYLEIYAACVNPVSKETLLQKLSASFNVSYETLIEYFSGRTVKKLAPEKLAFTPDRSISTHDIEDYILSIIIQNYDQIINIIDPEDSQYFQSNSTLFEKLITEELEVLLEDQDHKNKVEELLTKNLPISEDISTAYTDSIKQLKIKYIKTKINILKQELEFADETKQDEILQQINELIILLKSY